MRTALLGLLVVIGLCSGCATSQVRIEAGKATLHNDLKYSEKEKVLCIWNRVDQYATWPITIPKTGKYKVTMTYACPNGESGSEIEIAVGDQRLKTKTNGSNGFYSYITEDKGFLALTAGAYELKVTPISKPNTWVMDLREIVLTEE
jgi:hypothetical protein